MARIEERRERAASPPPEVVDTRRGRGARVEPLTFNLHALEDNADHARAAAADAPGGVGQLVVVAGSLLRKSCQVFINEALGRQRGLQRASRPYAQLSCRGHSACGER